MATALIDQWIAANGPLPPLRFATGNPADDLQAMTSQAFRCRVIMAAIAAAIAIAAEANTTPDHANRVALAKAVTDNPQNWLLSFSQSLASQTLDETSTDAAISIGVASVWNALAG